MSAPVVAELPPVSDEVAQKLTSWEKEPSLQQLKADFDIAKPHQMALVRKIEHWNALRDVKGSAAPRKVRGRSSVQPKLIRRQAEWRYSALSEPFLSSNKVFKVDPVSWEDEDAAKQNELVLNWQFRTKLNRVKFVDDYVRSTVDDGTCVLRLGWCRTFAKVKQEVPEYTHYAMTDPGQAQQFEQALQLRQENPQGYNDQTSPELKAAVDFYDESGQATTAAQTGVRTVEVQKIIENRPTVEVVDIRNFFLDPTCNGDPSKALFAILTFETNKAALLKEPSRYPKEQLEKVNWDAEVPMSTQDHHTRIDNGVQFTDSLRKKVVAIEYWGSYDIHGTGELVPVVCTWIGSTIIRLELNPFPDQKLPFILVPFLPKKREAFGEADAELLEDNQAILGAVVRGMIDLMGRSANAQRGMAKGMLDPLNKRRYDNGEDYEFNPNVNPVTGIAEHKYPELPQSALQMINLMNQEAEALTGVKSFAGGISGEAYGDVAAGIKGVLVASGKREMSIIRRLAQGFVEMGQKLISMNAAFLSEQEVVRVTNSQFVQLSPAQQTGAKAANDNLSGNTKNPKTANDMFVTVNREDLAGNFDLDVDISTAEVDNMKAQDMGFMIQTIGPSMPGLAQVIMADIADLKRMPALAHRIRTYQAPPDPMQQMQQQLLQAQLAAEQKKSELMDSEISLNQAKASQAGALARQAASVADKSDLDYVNDQTGVSHGRDMDKIQSQARSNQDLEVTKALLKPTKPEESKPHITAAAGFNAVTEAKDHVQNGPLTVPPVHPAVDMIANSLAQVGQAPASAGV